VPSGIFRGRAGRLPFRLGPCFYFIWSRRLVMKLMNASRFKAECLAILDEVARTGEPVTIVKRGKPVARLVPPAASSGASPQRDLMGSVEILGDLLAPVLPAHAWEAESRRRRR
jgi:prevent-host-death family protein